MSCSTFYHRPLTELETSPIPTGRKNTPCLPGGHFDVKYLPYSVLLGLFTVDSLCEKGNKRLTQTFTFSNTVNICKKKIT